jgi:hypothetical protein
MSRCKAQPPISPSYIGERVRIFRLQDAYYWFLHAWKKCTDNFDIRMCWDSLSLHLSTYMICFLQFLPCSETPLSDRITWVAIYMNRGPHRIIYDVGTESLRLRGTGYAKLAFWLPKVRSTYSSGRGLSDGTTERGLLLSTGDTKRNLNANFWL